MSRIKTLAPGIAVSALIALVCWFLGQAVPLVGGAVFAILLGMVIGTFWKEKGAAGPGIKFASKKILQTAVVLLGFGLPLTQLAQVGVMSLPVILSTISASLITAAVLCRVMHVPGRTATLIGVGSSICGGSAIAATAPVIKADDQEVAHAISVVFLFNVLAALIFPTLGDVIGLSNNGFGLFAGTAVNDTSSVTAAAAVWDGMHPGANALDYATIVKLTRTLAIIPTVLVFAAISVRLKKKEAAASGGVSVNVSMKSVFPWFILGFLAMSALCSLGLIPAAAASALKSVSKFLMVAALAAIGLNTSFKELCKSGARPMLHGFIISLLVVLVAIAVEFCLGVAPGGAIG